MAIEFDSYLPPLKAKLPALLPVDALLAVATVRLAARDVPARALRDFYTTILGLKHVDTSEGEMTFTLIARRVILDREMADPGHLALLMKDFAVVLQRLSEQAIVHEVFHSDDGLSRKVVLRDPALNWIQLMEHRPL